MPTKALPSCLLFVLIAASQSLALGCAPVVTRSGYTAADVKADAQCNVRFEYRSQLTAEEAREIGRIRVGDSGFSRHCSESEVRQIVRRDACGVGADIVDIQDEKAPSMMATCYHVDARLLALRAGSNVSSPLASTPQLGGSADSLRTKRAKANSRAFVRNAIIIGVVVGVAAGVAAGVASAQ